VIESGAEGSARSAFAAFHGSGAGGSAPRGQSLLRSFLATRSFPPRPPGYVLNRGLMAPQALALESLALYWLPNRHIMREVAAQPACEWSSDWRRGAASCTDPKALTTTTLPDS